MKIIQISAIVAVALSIPAVRAGAEEKFQLPPEVTPALRAACEHDVRRLCIGANPTIASVKQCVSAKFRQLGKSCQVELALVGFSR